MFFFRDPERTAPADPSAIVAGADGRVMSVTSMKEEAFLKTDCVRISIFLSLFDVHVNRAPVSGRVMYTRYHPGRYLVAYHPKASELNEHNTIVLADSQGRQILVRQIAGLLARRIVCYLEAGQPVTMGAELGFIKFGSRCDVFLPPDSAVKVSLKDRVKGGESILATLR